MVTTAIKGYVDKLFPTKTKPKAKTAEPVDARARGHVGSIYGISQNNIDAGLNIVNFRITSDCPMVGVVPVGRDGPLTGELLFPSRGRSRKIFAFLPQGTQQITLRNATNSALPTTFKRGRLSYARFADASRFFSPEMVERIRRASKHVLIHTLGKTGSVSLQNALNTIPNVLCSRDHFFNLPAIGSEPDALGATILRTLSLQTLISSRTIMCLLEQGQSRPESLDVICGLRRSETQVISALFQNQGATLQHWGTAPDAICSRLHDHFVGSFSYFEWWWTDQFCLTHGFSLDQLLQGLRREDLTWTYTAPSGVHFRFYRIEDGEAAMRECLLPYARFAPDPKTFPNEISRANVGADKSYAELYKATVARFDVKAARALLPPALRRIEEFFYGQD